LKAKNDQIKMLLIAEHTLFREGLAKIFAAEDNMRVVGQAQNGSEAVALAETEKPDAVLLDVETPMLGAERVIEGILRASPSSKVLVLTTYDDDPRLLRRLLALGARAYMPKEATRDELVATVRTIHRFENRVVLSMSHSTARRLGGPENSMLSVRELEVLLLMVRAMSNSQIASYLNISEGRAKRHLTNIYAKLSVCSRADATKEALKRGLLTLRDLSEPA
jgi:two-component system NarL family response regulator